MENNIIRYGVLEQVMYDLGTLIQLHGHSAVFLVKIDFYIRKKITKNIYIKVFNFYYNNNDPWKRDRPVIIIFPPDVEKQLNESYFLGRELGRYK